MLVQMRLSVHGQTLNTALGSGEKEEAAARRYLEGCREGWRRLDRYHLETLRLEEHRGLGPPPWR